MSRQNYTAAVDFYEGTTPEALIKEFGSPLYVYNERILRQRCRELKALSSHAGFQVNYSVKANSNPFLLQIVREEGLRVDAMSPGELAMDELAGYKGSEILYISNNNGPEETEYALAKSCLISVDSLSQLKQLGTLKPGAKVMIRINPGIGEGHHAKVITGGEKSKFGISARRLPEIRQLLGEYDLTLVGLNQHIGSLFMQPDKYLAACQILLDVARSLPEEIFAGLEILDFGGGFGIPYHKRDGEERLDLEQLGGGLHEIITAFAKATGYTGAFLVEPGRYVAAECGLLLGRCTAVKDNGHIRFIGTDIGFNVLMRPMLYDSFHEIEIYCKDPDAHWCNQTVVGNICESGDILAKDRLLPQATVGDIVALLDAGAYGFSMASNYNDRLLPAEVLLCKSGEVRVIRRRQNLADLTVCFPMQGDKLAAN